MILTSAGIDLHFHYTMLYYLDIILAPILVITKNTPLNAIFCFLDGFQFQKTVMSITSKQNIQISKCQKCF